MNKIQKRRIIFLSFFISGLAITSALILFALKQNINLFFTPSQLVAAHIKNNYAFRLGGMVKKNSLHRSQQDLTVEFIITDFQHDIPVRYQGVLPDLFGEERGVIADGKLTRDGFFLATQVLAKHDENYMPKNVYQALRKKSAV